MSTHKEILSKSLKVASAMVMGTTMVAVPILTNIADVYALDIKATPNGVASFGGGNASITIQGNQGQSLVGKKFNIYKLFNAENSKDLESINYTFNPAYEEALKQVVGPKIKKNANDVTEYEVIDYIQSLNTHYVEGADVPQELEGSYSKYRDFVEELRNKLVQLNLAPDTVTVTQTKANNSIQFTGLDFGYYLADEVSDTNGQHAASALCMVNTANPDASVNIKSDYTSMIKKILEDDGEGWNDIADYEIGQTIPYKYETHVPNMNGYDTFYFAFHDKMNNALTFNKNSVKITLSDQNGKSYVLKDVDFKVEENIEGDTFRISIDDLRALVNREFAEGLNQVGENTYGQSMVVEYNATLNDKAALDMGRPGFENSCRLEFSNDPDRVDATETGFTPWDTVVAFTYKLEATKVNNYDKRLEGAKFRLYSDADCQNEVFVKKTDQGYNVMNRDSLGGNDHTGGSPSPDAVEMVSDAQGNFVINGLDKGTYYLKETDAPDGYRAIQDPIVLKIKPTYTADRNNYIEGQGGSDATLQTLEATAYIKTFWQQIWHENEETLTTDIASGSAQIKIVNQVGAKLPITGSNGVIIALGGAGILGALGLYARSQTKKQKEE